jgi:4-amino-4-deoxy-L-arabinose transferase-like glycosyltransferase
MFNLPRAKPASASAAEPSHSTAWLLVAALALATLAPALVLRGMSLDGVVYATISRNLAVGIGQVWQPIYASPPQPFYEHPPLGFVLESVLFRLCGDHWWVERLYSMLTALPAASLMVLIWRRLVREPELRQFAWLGVVLWVAMPAWPWIYRNNYLENTVTVFTLLAVYAALAALQQTRLSLAWTAVSALAIAMAVFTKGPTGAFPLAAPTLIWLALRPQSFSRALLVQTALIAIVALLVALPFAFPQPRVYLTTYFQQQIVDSVSGRREIANSTFGRLQLLWGLARDLLLPATAAAAIALAAKQWASVNVALQQRKTGWLCLLLAASASIPIMISPKQTAYYTAPSWPFYCLALGLWSAASEAALLARIRELGWTPRWSMHLRRAALATMAAVVVVSSFWTGRSLRDRQLIADVERIGEIAGPHAAIAVEEEFERHWALRAYLYRLCYISIEPSESRAAYRLDPSCPKTSPNARPGWTFEAQLEGFTLLRNTSRLASHPSTQVR